MPSIDVSLQAKPAKITPRLVQLSSMFDVPLDEIEDLKWNFEADINEKVWNVGLVVGPSGAGKTTIARELFGTENRFTWSYDSALIDNFPSEMQSSEIARLLNSVGLSSVPTWIRPFQTLSNGEQFRANVAMNLATTNKSDICLMDEWTSVVDRQVAQVISTTIEKTIRRENRKLVCVSCHYDIMEWLQPDWVIEPHLGKFSWRCLRRRPELQLQIYEIDRSSWKMFKRHHYLSSTLPAGKYFGAFVKDECVAFCGVTHVVNPSKKAKNLRRCSRLVVLPDYQGLGIGMKLLDAVASEYSKNNYRFRISSVSPQIGFLCNKSSRWRFITQGAYGSGANAQPGLNKKQLSIRSLSIQVFEYQLPKDRVAQ